MALKGEGPHLTGKETKTMNNFKPGGPEPVTANININPNDIKNMKCGCGNDIFVTVQNLKFISPFYTGTSKPAGFKVEMNCCLECGILYPVVMQQGEADKYYKNPNVMRLNFEKLISKLLGKIVQAGTKG